MDTDAEQHPQGLLPNAQQHQQLQQPQSQQQQQQHQQQVQAQFSPEAPITAASLHAPLAIALFPRAQTHNPIPLPPTAPAVSAEAPPAASGAPSSLHTAPDSLDNCQGVPECDASNTVSSSSSAHEAARRRTSSQPSAVSPAGGASAGSDESVTPAVGLLPPSSAPRTDHGEGWSLLPRGAVLPSSAAASATQPKLQQIAVGSIFMTSKDLRLAVETSLMINGRGLVCKQVCGDVLLAVFQCHRSFSSSAKRINSPR